MIRQTKTLTLVLQDSDDSPVIEPYQQAISFAQWEDGNVPFQAVLGSTGLPANCTGGAFILTARTSYLNTGTPPLSREATATDYSFGTGYFPIGSVDTGIAAQKYEYNVVYIDSNGKRWNVLPDSVFGIDPSDGVPNTDVTVPESQAPLAQGPRGYPIDLALYDNSKAYAIGEGVTYFSMGTTSTYICTQATTAGTVPTNTSYWLLMASGSAGGGVPDPSSAPDGAVIIVESGVYILRQLTQDDILPGFSISSFAGSGSWASTKELGDTIINPSFTASYSSTPNSAQIADGINAPLVLSTPFTSGTETHTYSQSTPNATVTWTLTAVAAATKSATVTSAWRTRTWFGIQTPGTFNSAFITGLPSTQLASSATGSYSIGAGSGTKKAFLAVDSGLSQPTIFKDAATGFAVPMTLVATVSVTNAFSVARNIDLYESDNFLTSAFTLVAS